MEPERSTSKDNRVSRKAMVTCAILACKNCTCNHGLSHCHCGSHCRHCWSRNVALKHNRFAAYERCLSDAVAYRVACWGRNQEIKGQWGLSMTTAQWEVVIDCLHCQKKTIYYDFLQFDMSYELHNLPRARPWYYTLHLDVITLLLEAMNRPNVWRREDSDCLFVNISFPVA